MPAHALNFWIFGIGLIVASLIPKYSMPFRHPAGCCWFDVLPFYRTFQPFCNWPMSVINDRLRVQTHTSRVWAYPHICARWRTPVIRISYIALVNDKHVAGEQSRTTISIMLNWIELRFSFYRLCIYLINCFN